MAVLYLKVEYHGQLAPGHTAVLALAGAMDRTVASIWMRKGNFDALDTAVPGAVLVALPNSLWTSGLNTSGTPNRSFLKPEEPT